MKGKLFHRRRRLSRSAGRFRRRDSISNRSRRPALEPLEPRWMLTDVSGHITSDTVWDDTSEPCNLTGHLYVDDGVTLDVLFWGGGPLEAV